MAPVGRWRDTTFVIPFTSDSGYIAFKYKTKGSAWTTYDIDSLTIKPDLLTTLGEENVNITSIGPNPFSDATTITFSKPLNSAEIRIYSASGKALRRLKEVNGTEIKLERQDLDSGIYFFEVTQDDKQLIRAKVLVTWQ
jgi:hypothetical protein